MNLRANITTKIHEYIVNEWMENVRAKTEFLIISHENETMGYSIVEEDLESKIVLNAIESIFLDLFLKEDKLSRPEIQELQLWFMENPEFLTERQNLEDLLQRLNESIGILRQLQVEFRNVIGSTVVLHNPHYQRNVRLTHNGDTYAENTHTSLDKFIIVGAPFGRIALYNPQLKKFLRVSEDHVDAKGTTKNRDTAPSKREEFTIVDAGNNQIALHNPYKNRFIRVFGANVDTKGGNKDEHELPGNWTAERFTLTFINDDNTMQAQEAG